MMADEHPDEPKMEPNMADQHPTALSRRSALGVGGAAAMLTASFMVPQRAAAEPLQLEETFEVRKRVARRSWVIDISGRRILCFADPKADCVVLSVVGFLGAQELTPFHDAQLANATRAINAVVRKMRPPSGFDLSILISPDGPFLAWVQDNAIGSQDLAEVINTTLEIQSNAG
jgi:hypothetical protein